MDQQHLNQEMSPRAAQEPQLVQPVVVSNPFQSKLVLGLIGVVIAVFFGVTGFYLGRMSDLSSMLDEMSINPTVPPDQDLIACTLDAMECPDGSFVGRIGPNCEFAACPSQSEKLSLYSNETEGFSFKYGDNWKIVADQDEYVQVGTVETTNLPLDVGGGTDSTASITVRYIDLGEVISLQTLLEEVLQSTDTQGILHKEITTLNGVEVVAIQEKRLGADKDGVNQGYYVLSKQGYIKISSSDLSPDDSYQAELQTILNSFTFN